MSTVTDSATGHALNEEGKAAVAKGELELARKTFLRGARLGHPGAQYNYGAMCMFGEGGCRDHLEAARWFRKAAEQDHAAAQSNLGGMYALGVGVREDPRKAFELLLRAANAGDPGAQFNLGNLYAAGDGVAEDLVEAYKWLALAAASDFAEAQLCIPDQSGHRFHGKPATHSRPKRPLIPREAGHLFQGFRPPIPRQAGHPRYADGALTDAG